MTAASTLTRLYAALLQLYPPAFRAEFERELLTVFTDLVEDAERHGGLPAQRSVALREWTAFPLNLLSAHLRELKKDLHMDEILNPTPVTRLTAYGALGYGLAFLLLALLSGLLGGLANALFPASRLAVDIAWLLTGCLAGGVGGWLLGTALPGGRRPAAWLGASAFLLAGLIGLLRPDTNGWYLVRVVFAGGSIRFDLFHLVTAGAVTGLLFARRTTGWPGSLLGALAGGSVFLVATVLAILPLVAPLTATTTVQPSMIVLFAMLSLGGAFSGAGLGVTLAAIRSDRQKGRTSRPDHLAGKSIANQ